MVLQSVSYIFITFFFYKLEMLSDPPRNSDQRLADTIQSVASLNAACRLGWERLGGRMRLITPLGHIYVIIMTRVNKSLIKKTVSSYLPSGRKWISVSASQQDFPQELQNWHFQLFVANYKSPSRLILSVTVLNLSSPFQNRFSWRSKLPAPVSFVLWCWQQGVTSWAGASDCNFKPFQIAEKVNVTHLNPGAVGAVAALDPGAVSGAVNNYCHCHYRPSLNSLRPFRVAGIYHVRPGWAGGVTNVTEMNVLCDGRHYLCLTLFFVSALPEERCEDAGRWRVLAGGLPPPCPHSGSQQA